MCVCAEKGLSLHVSAASLVAVARASCLHSSTRPAWPRLPIIIDDVCLTRERFREICGLLGTELKFQSFREGICLLVQKKGEIVISIMRCVCVCVCVLVCVHVCVHVHIHDTYTSE